MQVSQPKVIIKEIDNEKCEPYEEATIDVPDEFVGVVIEKVSKRKGIIIEMKPLNGNSRLIFEIPTRGLLGYRGQFIMDTRGEGILCSRVIGFKPYAGEIVKRETGSMISMSEGKALSYSLNNLQERGDLYIGPNIDVYEGMVIGNVAKGQDMTVNCVKGKHLTNMRAAAADDSYKLTPPVEVTLERGLEIMAEDEYLEITPNNIRLRKQHLTKLERDKASK